MDACHFDILQGSIVSSNCDSTPVLEMASTQGLFDLNPWNMFSLWL